VLYGLVSTVVGGGGALLLYAICAKLLGIEEFRVLVRSVAMRLGRLCDAKQMSRRVEAGRHSQSTEPSRLTSATDRQAVHRDSSSSFVISTRSAGRARPSVPRLLPVARSPAGPGSRRAAPVVPPSRAAMLAQDDQGHDGRDQQDDHERSDGGYVP
jgi:hypothetical protein